MTIKDALDRAKKLRQARQSLEPAEQDARAELPPAGYGAERRPEIAEVHRAPPQHFDPLKAVEVSEEACAKNWVLVSDRQMGEVPQAAAAYRLIRSKVQQRLKRGNWTSLAICSPSQNDGKTVTTLNLALSIAREKQRPVYVVDLDMRNPSVCSYLGLKDLRPLPEYFSGDAEPADVIYQTSIPFFFVAGALTRTDSASEILAGPRLEQLLAHIRARSPDAIVIIDLPPVNVTDEALSVAPRVDAILVVVAEGGTRRNELARALSALGEFTVAGVVINRSSEHHVEYNDRYLA